MKPDEFNIFNKQTQESYLRSSFSPAIYQFCLTVRINNLHTVALHSGSYISVIFHILQVFASINLVFLTSICVVTLCSSVSCRETSFQSHQLIVDSSILCYGSHFIPPTT